MLDLYKILRLVCDFLWFENENHARTKVACREVSMHSTIQGGLGIIDPLHQIRALLANLVVQGLLLGNSN